MLYSCFALSTVHARLNLSNDHSVPPHVFLPLRSRFSMAPPIPNRLDTTPHKLPTGGGGGHSIRLLPSLLYLPPYWSSLNSLILNLLNHLFFSMPLLSITNQIIKISNSIEFFLINLKNLVKNCSKVNFLIQDVIGLCIIIELSF